MNTRTQTGFKTRLMAVLMLALVLFSAVGFTGQAQRGASFAPVTVAYAADGNIFDKIVDVGKNDEVTINNPTETMDEAQKWTPASLVAKSKTIAQLILGVCTVLSIVFLIINITKMGASSTNDQARKKAQTGILWSGISLALFGGLSIVVGFFWSFLTSGI